jgi:hypothetical protein
MTRTFENAERYLVADQHREILYHETPAEALQDYFDDLFLGDGETVADLLEDLSPITVESYHRVEVDIECYAASLADSLEGYIRDDDEYCNSYTPDTHELITWDRAELVKAIASAIGRFSKDVKPWNMEVAGSREYSAEEARALLPGYFT